MKQILNKSTRIKQIENKWGVEIEELLRQKYVDENKLAINIAKELGITYLTCIRWLQLAGIYSRKLKL